MAAHEVMRFASLARWGAAIVLTALCVGRAGLPAAAEDEGLAKRRAAEWQEALSMLTRHATDVDAALLTRLDDQLPSLDPRHLEELARSHEVNQLADRQGRLVRHGLRSLAYLRKIGKDLDAGPAICLALGETTDLGWARALLELCREPFGQRLGRVVEVLAVDERGPVRLIAGRVAGYLNAFCGGQGSEWRRDSAEWDATPLARSVARRLLADRNPAVAVVFALQDAYAIEDVTIVDWMVEQMGCDRQAPRVASGLLWTTEMTIGEACRQALDGQFIFYRRPSRGPPGLPPEPPERRVETLPDDDSAEAIGAWWGRVRDAWSFAPDGEGWNLVLDEILVLPRSGATRVSSPVGTLTLEITEYEEVVSTDGPQMSLSIDVARGEEWSFGGGNRRHTIGYVSRGASRSGGWAIRRSFKWAPATPEGIRVRFRLHERAERR